MRLVMFAGIQTTLSPQAMETADALGPYVNYVHLFAGRAPRANLLGAETNPEGLVGV